MTAIARNRSGRHFRVSNASLRTSLHMPLRASRNLMAGLSRKVGARPHLRQRESRVQLEWPSRRWLRSLASRDTAQRRISHPGTSHVAVATNHCRAESRQTRSGNRGLKTHVLPTEELYPGLFGSIEVGIYPMRISHGLSKRCGWRRAPQSCRAVRYVEADGH